MVSDTAEEAMRRACDAILAGDYILAMADLTPEALDDAMTLGAGLATVPVPESYAIESREESGGEHRFAVLFKTSLRDFRATATWRLVDGAWKVVAISVEGLG